MKLKCKVCGEKKSLAKCCKNEMTKEGDLLVCKSCGDINEIPDHCGKEMKVVRL